MDINRYEQELAALTPGGPVSDLTLSGIDPSFGNATLYTWTAGLERKLGGLTADATYVGTAAEKLPAVGFPNAYSGASPAFARYTTFDVSGNVAGGFGTEMVVVASSHSSYHALQVSLSGTMAHGGPGLQAGFTWGKSIDNSSGVIGGGTTPQNPFDYHPEKGPSSFDATTSFGISAAQDLHLDRAAVLRFAGAEVHIRLGAFEHRVRLIRLTLHRLLRHSANRRRFQRRRPSRSNCRAASLHRA